MTTQELVTHLYAEAMKLPEKERLQLVMSLSATMGPGIGDDADDNDDVEVSPELAAVLHDRIESIHNGTAVLIPADEAFLQLRARLSSR